MRVATELLFKVSQDLLDIGGFVLELSQVVPVGIVGLCNVPQLLGHLRLLHGIGLEYVDVLDVLKAILSRTSSLNHHHK